ADHEDHERDGPDCYAAGSANLLRRRQHLQWKCEQCRLGAAEINRPRVAKRLINPHSAAGLETREVDRRVLRKANGRTLRVALGIEDCGFTLRVQTCGQVV